MEASEENQLHSTGSKKKPDDSDADLTHSNSDNKDIKPSPAQISLQADNHSIVEMGETTAAHEHRHLGDSHDMPNLPTPSIEQHQDFDEDQMLNLLAEFNNNTHNTAVDEEPQDGEPNLTPLVETERIEDVIAQAEFQEKKKTYENMVKKKINTNADDIEFARTEDEEFRRQKVARKQQEYDNARNTESNPLFYTIADDIILEDPAAFSDALASIAHKSEEDDHLTTANNIEITRSEPEKRTKRGRKPGSKQSNPTSSIQKGRVEKKTSGRGRRRRSPDLLNMPSLMRNDIVANAQANQGQASQPSFTARNRKKALDQLLSSIPEEHQQLHKQTVKHLEAACRKFSWKGQGTMYSDEDGKWRLKGMKSSLYHFQLLGCAWMRDKEDGSRPPFGGIIADSMGLGKTITAICNMIEGRPKAHARNKTTLIVTPSSLCDQWMAEIKKHCEPDILGEVIIYRSKSRPQSIDMCETLKKCGVVITTYSEVMKQLPKCDPPAHLDTEEGKNDWWKKKYEEEKGPLLRIAFHRVMLDEAQTIKNHQGQTSKACRLLYSKYRWVITGTPLSNRIEELYPYFEFIGVEGSGSFEAFKQNFGKRNDISKQRLDSILRKVMIRRTNADKMFGLPIVKLPALNHQVIPIPFDRVERLIYQIVHARFLAQLNQWKMEGTVLKQAATIMVMLTRLRQMCAHVLLISKCIGDILEAEDIEKISRLLNQVQVSGEKSSSLENSVVLGQVLEDASNADAARQDTIPSDDATSNQGGPSGLPAFPMSINFTKILRDLMKAGNFAEVTIKNLCHKCKQFPSHRRLTVPCCHMYCEQCLTSMLNESASTKVDVLCLHCSTVITGQEKFREISDAVFNSITKDPQNRRGSSSDSEPDEFAWMEIPGTLMSSKAKVVIRLIDNWFTKHPNSKVIVFVQWLGMLEVLAKLCNIAGWGFCKFTGKMNTEARLKSIQEFQDTTSEKKVLLSSLRCGGVGLNLTAARFVVICDPWWNESAEDQAFSRAYRIGQNHDVEVRKLIIEDTVETELILALQKMKTKEINRTLNEDERPKDKYDVDFLIRLFGPAERDPVTGERIFTDESNTGDEFVIAEDQQIVDNSDVEDPNFTPAKPF